MEWNVLADETNIGEMVGWERMVSREEEMMFMRKVFIGYDGRQLKNRRLH